MINPDFDILIVGSGPAGVSAAFPLLKAGLKVLMVDGGGVPKDRPPRSDFLSWRESESNQAHRIIGKEFYALKMLEGNSPKLRAPSLEYVFQNFAEKNRIVTNNFMALGSLAVGGLSNAWGCGVSRFSDADLRAFPFNSSEIKQSYKDVSTRIGLSGKIDDNLSDYFGLDEYADDPIALDEIHQYFSMNYELNKHKLRASGFNMGRTRLAVLSRNYGDRKACSLTGNCFWGCNNRALYSSRDELETLRSYKNFYFKSGFIVTNLSNQGSFWAVNGQPLSGSERQKISAKKILLAAGTLATTRIAFQALNITEERQLLSCPTAGFMVWTPKFLGSSRKPSFGLGQLSFSLTVNQEVNAFGSTLSTTGIPVSEFIRHTPFGSRYAADLLKNLLSSCVAGNLFLPPEFGPASVRLTKDGELLVSSSSNLATYKVMKTVESLLRKNYFKIGGILLPGSFTIGHRGGDIHYSGTMPMKKTPKNGETDRNGEIVGLKNIYAVDGASLSSISEKPHTLTIMANADRIGKIIAGTLPLEKIIR